MTYKVLSTSPSFGFYVQEPVDYLKVNGCQVKLIPQGKKLSEADLCEAVGDVDAVIVGVEKITRPVVEAGKKVKIFIKHGAGVDNIDVVAATKNGIVVGNAPGTNSDAVADLTIGLFLALGRQIPFANQIVKNGQWERIVGSQFSSKTLGIIGLGKIGKRVAKRAVGFGTRILAHDLVPDNSFAEETGVTYVGLYELLGESDFISIHLPLNDSTRGMIGEKEFKSIKTGAFLVNIARGNIVDETALYKSLKNGKIRGAALDVFSQEPPEKENKLLQLENVIASPHMGAYTYEALNLTGMMCVKDIVRILQGQRPENIVNPEVLGQKG